MLRKRDTKYQRRKVKERLVVEIIKGTEDLQEEEFDGSLYDWLLAHDVYTWLRPLIDGGAWVVQDNGRLRPKFKQFATETPWVHHGHAGFDCFVWSSIMFNIVSLNMGNLFIGGKPFVPSGCQNCYKVVVRPKTLVQLFALNDLQERSGRPSKCGIEVRPSVHGLYGGYFYNAGKEAGEECYLAVREAVDNDPYLGEDVAVILKRGCTEMEHAVGPSDEWEITEAQETIEKLVKEWVVQSERDVPQPDPLVWHVKRKWIEFAWQNGDTTYSKFTKGKSLFPAYKTYHNDLGE